METKATTQGAQDKRVIHMKVIQPPCYKQQYENFFSHVEQGHLDKVKHYINYNPKFINSRRQEDLVTPLMLSAKHGHLPIIRYILSLDESLYDGKDELLNATDETGMRPLEYAALYGHEECANVLIDAGTDPCIQVSNGNRALHFAACSGLVGLCKRLICEYGMDPDVENDQHETPLMLASRHNRIEVVEYLICNASLKGITTSSQQCGNCYSYIQNVLSVRAINNN